jgi:hypothetical protein
MRTGHAARDPTRDPPRHRRAIGGPEGPSTGQATISGLVSLIPAQAEPGSSGGADDGPPIIGPVP